MENKMQNKLFTTDRNQRSADPLADALDALTKTCNAMAQGIRKNLPQRSRKAVLSAREKTELENIKRLNQLRMQKRGKL